MSIATLRPFPDLCFKRYFTKYMSLIFSILKKCTIILLIGRASARAHWGQTWLSLNRCKIPTLDERASSFWSKPQRSLRMQNQSGPARSVLCLTKRASKSVFAINQSLFLSRLCVTVTISIACHVVAGNSNLKYILKCTNDKLKQKGKLSTFHMILPPTNLHVTHSVSLRVKPLCIYCLISGIIWYLFNTHLCTAVRICLEGAKWTAILVESFHIDAKNY